MGNYNDMIDAKLGRLQSIVARIRQSQGVVSKLEIDLFLQILRELYEDGLSMADGVNNTNLDSHFCIDEESANQSAVVLPFAADADFVVPDSVMSEVEEDNNDNLFDSGMSDLEDGISDEDSSDEKELFHDDQVVENVPEPQFAQTPVVNVSDVHIIDVQPEPDPVPVQQLEAEPVSEPDSVLGVVAEPLVESVTEIKSEAVMEDQKPDGLNVHVSDKTGQVSNVEDPKGKESIKQPSLFDFISKKGDQGSDLTLGESLVLANSENHDTVGQIVTSRKISDLRDIININDRFNFVNNLFSSNIRAYNECISKLNEIVTKDEAMAYLETIAEHYGWNENSAVVENFYKVIGRKF